MYMSLKNNQTIAGFIFITLWVLLLLFMSSKSTYSPYYEVNEYEGSYTNGHPLWNN